MGGLTSRLSWIRSQHVWDASRARVRKRTIPWICLVVNSTLSSLHVDGLVSVAVLYLNIRSRVCMLCLWIHFDALLNYTLH